jgi:hypothetical protein
MVMKIEHIISFFVLFSVVGVSQSHNNPELNKLVAEYVHARLDGEVQVRLAQQASTHPLVRTSENENWLRFYVEIFKVLFVCFISVSFICRNWRTVDIHYILLIA